MVYRYTHNSDLSLYDKSPSTTNCGSYALRLNEWYHLDRHFHDLMGETLEDWIIAKTKVGYSEYEITYFYEVILIKGLLLDFEGELEVCDGTPPETDDMELIAFNAFCYCIDSEFADADFHFKVFREGQWKEKCGKCQVRECDKEHWGSYIGDPFYFYHKIG